MSQLYRHQNQHKVIDNLLDQAFPSRHADLAANRAGHLTPAQQIRLYQERQPITCIVWLAGLICAFFIGLEAIGPLPHAKPNNSPIIGACLVGLCLVAPGLFVQRALTQDIQSNTVIAVQGLLKKRTARGYRNTNHYIEADQISLQVSGEIYEAFIEDQTYILYYAPKSKTLVSAEHIPSP